MNLSLSLSLSLSVCVCVCVCDNSTTNLYQAPTYIKTLSKYSHLLKSHHLLLMPVSYIQWHYCLLLLLARISGICFGQLSIEFQGILSLTSHLLSESWSSMQLVKGWGTLMTCTFLMQVTIAKQIKEHSFLTIHNANDASLNIKKRDSITKSKNLAQLIIWVHALGHQPTESPWIREQVWPPTEPLSSHPPSLLLALLRGFLCHVFVTGPLPFCASKITISVLNISIV